MEKVITQAEAHVRKIEKKVKELSDGSLESSLSTTDISVFVKWAKDAKSHCYMIGVNSRDRKKLDSVIVHLLGKNMLIHVFNKLDSSKLFLSTEHLIPLQKEIAKEFPQLKFMIVTVNRSCFPKQRYC